MSNVISWGRVLLVLLLFASTSGAKELLNSSFDVSREMFAELNLLFAKEWQQQTGHKLTIKQSHGGTSRQALSILNGLRADVVTYNQVTDIQILHDRANLLPANWQSRLPHNSSPFYSTMAFLVRKGNPKQIHDWQDLVRDNIKLVFPNPKTSGNGRYIYLAAWGAQQQVDSKDKQKIRAWMGRFLHNVAVFDVGGRGASTTFVERAIGDVLITFESEVNLLRKQYPDQQFEVILPKTDILAEMPVAWLDKNVSRNQTEKESKAYLEFLFSEAAQRVIAKYHYRVMNKKVMQEVGEAFPKVEIFRVEERIGSWAEVMKTHFAQGGILDQLLAEGRR